MTRFDLARFYKDRRRAQAGTTLIELLVSLVIIGFAVTLIVGTFSTGVIDATLAKRNTAAQAVVQYELDKISASAFDPSKGPYSECFATDDPSAPVSLANYRDPCPSSSYTLRADVARGPDRSPTAQLWTVVISSSPDVAQVGDPVSVYKVSR